MRILSRVFLGAFGSLLLLASCGDEKTRYIPPPDEDSRRGSLRVEIWGLPAEAEASVRLLGSDGFEESLGTSIYLENLPPVAYALEAEVVQFEDKLYRPTVLGSPIVLEPDALSFMQVRYAPGDPVLIPSEPGMLRVEITGLPPEAEAAVKVRGSDGFEQHLQASTTLEELPLVAYVVEADIVHLDGRPFYPSVTGSPAYLEPASLTAVRVHHAPHPFSISAPSLALPLTAEVPLEIAVLRHGSFDGEVKLEILDPFPPGIEISERSQSVPREGNQATFLLRAGDGIEALDAPMWLRIRATGAGMSSDHFVEVRASALVTSPDDDGPGSLREVLRAATAISDSPKVRFSPDVFSAPTTIPLESELIISSSVDLEGPVAQGQHLVTLAPASQGSHRLVVVEDGEVRIARLHLAQGETTTDGGCLHNAGTLLIEKVSFRSCSAHRGGGLANTGRLEFRDGSFEGNVSQADGGAAFSTGSLRVTNVAFTSNESQRGGALALGANTSASVVVSGATFTANRAREGGGVWAQGPVEVSLRSSTLRNNLALDEGGAIRIQGNGTLVVEATQFSSNEALRGGALSLDEAGSVHIRGGGFDANEAQEGGAIRNAGVVVLEGGLVVGNVARIRGGGAIYNLGRLVVEGSRFEANDAKQDGGVIFHAGPALLSVQGSTFLLNTAGAWGGAISVETEAQAIVDSSTFQLNSSKSGGALSSKGYLTVVGSSFDQNQASQEGGGIRSLEGHVEIHESEFTNNHTQNDGGAIMSSSSTVVDSCHFEGNRSFTHGGGIHMYGRGSLVLTSSSFIFNKGLWGSALSIMGTTGGGTWEIFNSTFSGNTHYDPEAPEANAWAIFMSTGELARLFHTTVAGNRNGLYSDNTVEGFGNIFAGNSNGNFDPAHFISKGYNIFGIEATFMGSELHPTDISGTFGQPLDPRLAPPAYNGGPTQTMLPLPTSPARNAIPHATCIPPNPAWANWRQRQLFADQRGISRPQGSSCDIGAAEVL